MVSEAVRVSDGWILGSSVTFISWVLGPRSLVLGPRVHCLYLPQRIGIKAMQSCYFTACEETAACEIIIKCSFTRVSEFIITKSGRIVQSVNGLVSIVRARKVVIMNLQ